MQTFTPFQYLLINIANHFGLDKETYATRIAWTTENLNNLEAYTDKADDPMLFTKAVLELRKVEQGQPVGTLVSFDAVCSGIQILSALTRCQEGCKATGLINTGKRPNAYLEVQSKMEDILDKAIHVSYKDIKQAVMTSCYGSQAVPKSLFEGKVLDAFNEACRLVAPGAFNILPVLRDTWNPTALVHTWKLPDNFIAYVPVMQQDIVRLEIDELNGYKMSTLVTVNEPCEYGLANIANITHSIDAYILRTLIRYCSYNIKQTKANISEIKKELSFREKGKSYGNKELTKHIESVGLVDITLVDRFPVRNLPTKALKSILSDLQIIVDYPSFEVIPVHDCFSCHPNHMERLRMYYNYILASLSESTLLEDILKQMYNEPDLTLEIFDESIYNEILENDYAIC